MPTFAELSDEAKEIAREQNRPDHDWWGDIYEDAVECAKCLGIEIGTEAVRLYGGGTRQDPQIYFSGFSSQGDGAMFLGKYTPRADACAAIAAHAPQDEELKRIAMELTSFQIAVGLQYGRQIECEVKEYRNGGSYSHSGCIYVDATFVDDGGSPTNQDEWTLRDLLRAFADWIYKQLEAEYDYLCSDEALSELEFDEEGALV